MAEYYPSDELLDRLRSDTVTNEDVMEFLWGQHNALRDSGQASPPVSMFFNEKTDLQHYAAARAWWPKRPDLPHQFAFPTLYLLCWSYQENHPNIGATFFDRLSIRSNAVVKWLEENKISVAQPNETPAQKRKRQNREAQARYRAKTLGEPNAPKSAVALHAEAVTAAYQAYLEVCAERRAVLEYWAGRVNEARQAYVQIKNTPPSELQQPSE